MRSSIPDTATCFVFLLEAYLSPILLAAITYSQRLNLLDFGLFPMETSDMTLGVQ